MGKELVKGIVKTLVISTVSTVGTFVGLGLLAEGINKLERVNKPERVNELERENDVLNAQIKILKRENDVLNAQIKILKDGE